MLITAGIFNWSATIWVAILPPIPEPPSPVITMFLIGFLLVFKLAFSLIYYASVNCDVYCFTSLLIFIFYMVAIHLSSIAIGVGSELIATVVLHGWFSLK